MTYLSGSFTSSMNSIPNNTPSSLLSSFYSYPWDYYSWIYQVFNIKENGISIMLTILLVSMIFLVVLRFNKD